MWYEIIPSFSIMVAAVSFPAVFSYYSHKFLQNGNPYKRDFLTHPYDLGLYCRDVHLSGGPYNMKSLENIPDED